MWPCYRRGGQGALEAWASERQEPCVHADLPWGNAGKAEAGAIFRSWQDIL